MRFTTCSILGLLAFAASPALAQHEHDHGHTGDFVVGITGPTAALADTLAVEGDVDTPVFLAPVSGLLSGWTATTPGFGHLTADEGDEGFYVLAPGAAIRLEVIRVDAGLAIVEPGFGAIAAAPGESILLGGDDLHAHATWYAQSLILGSDWTGVLTATFKLVDAGSTGYADSPPFSMTFTNVPEPASLALLGLGGVTVGRRGRRV